MKFIAGKIHKKFLAKSNEECTIRWADWNDLEQLTSYINELAEEDTYIIYSPGDNETIESETNFLSMALKDGSLGIGSFLVAEVNGKVVGTGGVRLDEHGRKRSKHVAIFAISVAKNYRNQGVGNELMAIALKHAEGFLKGIKLIKLTVFGDNVTAISLYKKHGFRQAGVVPGAYLRKGKYSDEVTMVKEI